jgi:hypothetical protein
MRKKSSLQKPRIRIPLEFRKTFGVGPIGLALTCILHIEHEDDIHDLAVMEQPSTSVVRMDGCCSLFREKERMGEWL